MTMTRIQRTAIGLAALSAVAGGALLLRARGREAEVRADEAVDLATASVPADPWAVGDTAPAPLPVYERFETLTTADGLPSDRITTVVVEGDDLFVGTEDGAGFRRGGKWTVHGVAEGLPHRFVTSVARDRAADITWLTTLRGVVRISGGKLDVISQKTSGLQNDVVYHAVVDGPHVWFATASGTSILDTRTGSWSMYDSDNSIMNEPWNYSIALGPERAWIGVWAGGIVELNRRTNRWREYRDPDGELEIDLLPDDGALHEVSSFVAYDAGLLWQSTYFGVARFDGRRWSSWTQADGGLPGDFVVHVAARGRAAWIASDQGFGVISGDTVVSYRRNPDGTCLERTVRAGKETGVRTIPTAPADDATMWVAPVDGGVWIATGHGLSHGVESEKR